MMEKTLAGQLAPRNKASERIVINRIDSSSLLATGVFHPVVAVRVAVRKAPPRPPLFLDSGDEEENGHAGGPLDSSLSSNR